MDDNIINLKILNKFDTKKIIYFYPKPINYNSIKNHNKNISYSWFSLLDIDEHGNEWWWDKLPNGRPCRKNIKNLLNNQNF